MANMFLTTYDETAVAVTVTGTSETTVYDVTNHIPAGVVGGTLDDVNTLWICSRFKVTLNDSSELSIKIKYGLALEVELTFNALGGTPLTDIGLTVEGYLSALSNSFQALHGVGTIQLAASDWGGVPNNRNGGTEDSDSDQPLKVTARFNGGGNSITHQHTFVVKIGTPAEVTVDDANPAETQVLSVSLLNKLPVALYIDVTFYAEFLHHLDFFGIGVATVARAGSANATWRDGTAHLVAPNLPRFEYSGETPLGLLINSVVGETLTVGITNTLSNGNTLFWRENNVNKNTTTNTNPFNGSGVWIGTNNIHISHVLKFNRVLTTTEINTVRGILTRFSL